MNKKRVVLGFDETNNGFSIPHAPFLLVSGCLSYEGRGYGTPPFGSKSRRGFFGARKVSHERILEYAKQYLTARPDFLYTVIPQKEVQRLGSANYLKAKAISSLCIRFFRDFQLPHDTPIYIHQIDDKPASQMVEAIVGDYLDIARIRDHNVRVLTPGKQEKDAVRNADVTGYYIAAIKHFLKPSKWPFKDKRVHLYQLEDLIFETRLSNSF